MTVGQMESWDAFRVTTEWIEANNHNTPCVNPWPAGAIFRSDKDMITADMNRLNTLLTSLQPNARNKAVQFIEFYLNVGLWLLPFALRKCGMTSEFMEDDEDSSARNVRRLVWQARALGRSRFDLS